MGISAAGMADSTASTEMSLVQKNQFQAPPQHVQGWPAQMSHAGSHLPGANHWQFDIDVDRRVCHEPATEFPIELRGNQVGQGSSQERAGADPPLPAALATWARAGSRRSSSTPPADPFTTRPIRGSQRVLYPSRYIGSPGPVELCLWGAAPLYWSRPCTASAQFPRLSADNLDHFQAYPR